MPVSEDKMRNPESLHRWFAISSVLMTLSILWMIQVDYQRPWRDFQDHYYLAKATLSHLDYLDQTRWPLSRSKQNTALALPRLP